MLLCYAFAKKRRRRLRFSQPVHKRIKANIYSILKTF